MCTQTETLMMHMNVALNNLHGGIPMLVNTGQYWPNVEHYDANIGSVQSNMGVLSGMLVRFTGLL